MDWGNGRVRQRPAAGVVTAALTTEAARPRAPYAHPALWLIATASPSAICFTHVSGRRVCFERDASGAVLPLHPEHPAAGQWRTGDAACI